MTQWYTYGNNIDGTNMGTLLATSLSDAISQAIVKNGDRTEGRVRYYRTDPLRDAAVTCVSEPNCTRYDLVVNRLK